MTIFKGKSGVWDASTPGIESLEEETFLRNLTLFPYLLEREEIKDRLKAVSEDWKKKITKKKREVAWEYTLYLIHLCPHLLDLSEFRWLKERFYGILMMRLCSSEHDKSYWKAMERVRKDFSPTKPKTPENSRTNTICG